MNNENKKKEWFNILLIIGFFFFINLYVEKVVMLLFVCLFCLFCGKFVVVLFW